MSNIKQKLEPWFEARKRHRLSHAHVQMARELGMNPKNLGKIDNHRQQAWKAPLPEFIESLYFKRFRRDRPETVLTLEDLVRIDGEKRVDKAKRKAERAAAAQTLGDQACADELADEHGAVEWEKSGSSVDVGDPDDEGEEVPF